MLLDTIDQIMHCIFVDSHNENEWNLAIMMEVCNLLLGFEFKSK